MFRAECRVLTPGICGKLGDVIYPEEIMMNDKAQEFKSLNFLQMFITKEDYADFLDRPEGEKL